MKIEEAIEKLDAMSAIADRTTTYYGLRATPIAVTGVIGLFTACVQTRVLSSGGGDFGERFVWLWASAAVICLVVILSDMWIRYRRQPTTRTRRLTLQVLGRLAPSILTGGAVAWVIMQNSPELVWTLPSWWAICLGMGVFSAANLLPSGLRPVGAWYIGNGLILLMIAKGNLALHPATMAIPFGGGQLLTAWLISREPRQEV